MLEPHFTYIARLGYAVGFALGFVIFVSSESLAQAYACSRHTELAVNALGARVVQARAAPTADNLMAGALSIRIMCARPNPSVMLAQVGQRSSAAVIEAAKRLATMLKSPPDAIEGAIRNCFREAQRRTAQNANVFEGEYESGQLLIVCLNGEPYGKPSQILVVRKD